MNRIFLQMILLICPLWLSAQKIDNSLLEGLKPRQIGPAGMSGRITALDVNLNNNAIIYAGTASGGLWRSESGGIAWTPIFEDQGIAAIGAVKINQRNPDEIWVGTGEGNPRNSQSSGNGIYKSVDGGRTWQHMGLKNSRNIHRIIIDPYDPNTVYVGVQGSAWGPGEQRGVFKTIDGGKTWKKILYVGPYVGVGDMVIDPNNSNKLIVAMWEFKRSPWFFESGGEGSGLHITYDGGESWKKVTAEDGLPTGELGRMGIAFAASRPDLVYALVEAEKNGLYKSTDGGLKWSLVSNKNVGSRPFYYAELYVDPHNENRIYNIYSYVSVSQDGGKTFTELLPWNGKPTNIHPDHHAWWIDPENPDFMIDGNDGGLNITRDGGKNWRFVGNIPVAQFYHINYDMELPYNVYGGMQDNGSWKGPAYTWQTGGIRNAHWEELFFGDGFDAVPDQSDNNYVYAMSQGGYLGHVHVPTGSARFIKPVAPEGEKLRFNWNAAIAHSPTSKTTIYFGSQYVHKSTDRGYTWEIISPDLTTNDPEKQKQAESGGLTPDVTEAENHTTILCIAPSRVNENVIWVGTDDGNLQLTADGGSSWKNLANKLPGLPAGSWIPQIVPSASNANEALVVANNYRRDDWTPYLFHTKDGGKSWTNLVENAGLETYVLSVVQDPVEPSLLFCGTESGLYFSIDYGKNWTKWHKNMPVVSVFDLQIHPREHDLIMATFGRAAFVLDNIQPLRILASENGKSIKKPLKVYPAPDAYIAAIREANGSRFAGNAEFFGDNRPFGVQITLSVKELKNAEEREENPTLQTDTVEVLIKNLDGELVRNFKATIKEGFSRVLWDLKENGPRWPSVKKPKEDDKSFAGYYVDPGEYMVVVKYGDDIDSTRVKVAADPRFPSSKEEVAQRRAMMQAFNMNVASLTTAVDKLREAEAQLKLASSYYDLKKGDEAAARKDSISAITEDLKKLKEIALGDPNAKGYVYQEDELETKLKTTYDYVASIEGVPSKDQKTLVERNKKEIEEYSTKVDEFIEKRVTPYVLK